MRFSKFSAKILLTLLVTESMTVQAFAGVKARGVDYINNPSGISESVSTQGMENMPQSVQGEAETGDSASSAESGTGLVTIVDGIRVPKYVKPDADIQADLSQLSGGGANMDWGNYYPVANSAPVGNADESWLRAFDTYSKEMTAEKVCYLTFDLGYENGHTASIMNTLKKHNAPATFFVTGACTRSDPGIVLSIAQNGFTVGNHTLSHKNMSTVTTKELFYTEVNTVEEQYETLTGHPMNRYYRPPEGKFSEAQLMLARAMGYKTMLWSVAYKDYDDKAQPSRSSALATLNKRIHPGAIVLLHATSSTNDAILDELLTGWESAGYTFKSLDDLPENEYLGQ
ncbi:polysaccharide deacetylase family protein [Oribacterium sp. FC2011]|uniref:polysaccharide deacetylase family protein n=1 Tax=Oribacterium sp. FC2011 TaxID=1408311 RepID=UPI000678A993|nr:polysaccharide deacetylase family protein [Oribacterium sp. FC2011]